jgi:hypothetical protein
MARRECRTEEDKTIKRHYRGGGVALARITRTQYLIPPCILQQCYKSTTAIGPLFVPPVSSSTYMQQQQQRRKIRWSCSLAKSCCSLPVDIHMSKGAPPPSLHLAAAREPPARKSAGAQGRWRQGLRFGRSWIYTNCRGVDGLGGWREGDAAADGGGRVGAAGAAARGRGDSAVVERCRPDGLRRVAPAAASCPRSAPSRPESAPSGPVLSMALRTAAAAGSIGRGRRPPLPPLAPLRGGLGRGQRPAPLPDSDRPVGLGGAWLLTVAMMFSCRSFGESST